MKKVNPKYDLYFIAIVLNEGLGETVHQLKHDIHQQFGSKAALRSPAHITLHMPFRKTRKHETSLKEAMDKMASRHQSFDVALHDFGCFTPRVVFIQVESSEALDNLQVDVQSIARQDLKLDNANYKQHPFTPHVTIGFRDLSKPNFHKAWEYYGRSKFDQTFRCENISLLKHDGQMWQEYYVARLA